MSLIERDPAFFNDAGDDPRFGRARADRANALSAAFRNLVNFGAHLRRGQKRIASSIHRRAAGMRGLSAESDRMPLDPKSSEHGAERKIEIEKHRALFD